MRGHGRRTAASARAIFPAYCTGPFAVYIAADSRTRPSLDLLIGKQIKHSTRGTLERGCRSSRGGPVSTRMAAHLGTMTSSVRLGKGNPVLASLGENGYEHSNKMAEPFSGVLLVSCKTHGISYTPTSYCFVLLPCPKNVC